MFISPKIIIKKTLKGKSLVAQKPIKEDSVLIKFEGTIINQPTKFSLQIDEGKHLDGPGNIDDYLNHSCAPNAHIDFSNISLKALRHIKKGEEITFNYLTTEWDMASKFECQCKNKNCLHHIYGFKYLTLQQKQKLKPLLSPFLRNKLTEELKNKKLSNK